MKTLKTLKAVKTSKNIFIVAAGLLALSIPLTAAYFENGLLPFPWLSDTYSIRADGMGRAFTALSDDPSGIFFNPAGLGLLMNSQLSVGHRQGFAEVNTESVVLTRLLLGGTFACAAVYHHAPDLAEIRNSLETGDHLNYQNAAAMLSYGRKVWRWINAGFSVRYAGAAVGNTASRVITADAGALFNYNDLDDYLPDFNFASFGVSILNIFPSLDYADKPEDLDLTLRMGLAVRCLNMMTLTVDFEDTKDRNAVFKAGYEFFPLYFLALRVGYIFTDRQDSILDRFTFGVGIGNRVSGGTLSLETSLRYTAAAGFLCEAGLNWVFNNPRYYISMKDRLETERAAEDRIRSADAERQRVKEIKLEKKKKKETGAEGTEAPTEPETPPADNTNESTNVQPSGENPGNGGGEGQ